MDKRINRRNLLKQGLAAGLTLAGLAGCEKKEPKNKEITLRVSEYNRAGIGYCGMSDEKRFSLSTGYSGSVNYYYPIDAKQIFFDDKKYNVISVDTNQITLRRAGK